MYLSDINECDPHPCRDSEICEDRIASYSCQEGKFLLFPNLIFGIHLPLF